MNPQQILTDLIATRRKIDAAILTVQDLIGAKTRTPAEGRHGGSGDCERQTEARQTG